MCIELVTSKWVVLQWAGEHSRVTQSTSRWRTPWRITLHLPGLKFRLSRQWLHITRDDHSALKKVTVVWIENTVHIANKHFSLWATFLGRTKKKKIGLKTNGYIGPPWSLRVKICTMSVLDNFLIIVGAFFKKAGVQVISFFESCFW